MSGCCFSVFELRIGLLRNVSKTIPVGQQATSAKQGAKGRIKCGCGFHPCGPGLKSLEISGVREGWGLRLAVVVVSWVGDSRLWPEQFLADRLQLFFGQQTCFQGGFAEALFAGSNNDVQVSRHIMDQALDWNKWDTAHGGDRPHLR